MRAASFGGGRQTMALLVLAARGTVDFPTFIFANVGAHAENPSTLTYVEQVAKPYAAEHGVELAEVAWVGRDGRTRDLYDDLLSARRSIDIPVRLGSGAFGNRKCTARYKIEVVAKELKRRGATEDDPAVVALGISTDEIERAVVGVPKQQPWTTRVNPLIDLGLSLTDCVKIITDEGLPVPPKSACWFCPFQGAEQWQERRRHDPDLFDRAVALEATLNERRDVLGLDRVGLATAVMSLDQAVNDQLVLDGMACNSGWCMT